MAEIYVISKHVHILLKNCAFVILYFLLVIISIAEKKKNIPNYYMLKDIGPPKHFRLQIGKILYSTLDKYSGLGFGSVLWNTDLIPGGTATNL